MKLIVSDHAVERYRSRVKPALDLAQARSEIEALLPMGERRDEPPEWCVPDPKHDGKTYIVITHGIAFALDRERVVVTCLTTGERSEQARERRNERKQRKRKARRHKAVPHKRGGRPKDVAWD